MFQFKNKLFNAASTLYKGGMQNLSNRFASKTTNMSMKPQFNFSRFNSFFHNNLNYPATYYLIGANLLVYGLYQFNIISPRTFIENFTLGQPQIQSHHYHTVATYSFAHSNFIHLAANMLGLYFFGKFIEGSYGPRALTKLYFGGALLGGLFILLDTGKKRSNQIHLGASASVSAIVTNFALNFPRLTVIFYIIPMPAWLLGVLLLLQSVVFYGNNGGISHQGHLGGIMFGGISYMLMKRGRF